MDYSIVIPVFNREDLTRNCLAALPATLDGAGEGEVIVVDNGSNARTAEVLAQFPWVRVIRNERNLGFAAACNQGTRAAHGRLVCHLNNDTIPLAGWLARMMATLQPGVGIVGARLLFPDDTIQHAGVITYPTRFGPEGFGPYHWIWKLRRDVAPALQRMDFDIVTGACMLLSRDLYLELGGFDEGYWNGYEDVDLCLKVRAHGLRVVYEPDAVVYHFESQSGVQRKRRLSHNIGLLAQRWGQRVVANENRYWPRYGQVRREIIRADVRSSDIFRMPSITAIVHGPRPTDPAAFLAPMRAGNPQPTEIVWAADGNAPAGCVSTDVSLMHTVRKYIEERGDRYVALVDTRTVLEPEWLLELIDTLEFGDEICAATVVPAAEQDAAVEPLGADARCTLLSLRSIPLPLALDECATLDGTLVDFTLRAVELGLAVRAVRRPAAALPAALDDPIFAERHGMPHDIARRADAARLENACRDRAVSPTFASIIMLSWNASDYTRMAVESIRAHTHSPYEIVIVDNGSDSETLVALSQLDDCRIIYNATNLGFAHGCNQGIAAATGTHIVLLNNDVVVTDGWLEALLAAHQRDPLVGVSAPLSNRIAGHQQIPVTYNSVEEMHVFAVQRATTFAGRHYRTDRAIGFCLCISRAVIDAIGGIDTRYGIGNFEDDDYCIRVRAAGFQIAICEDVFIHHFGSVTFKANNVDWQAKMAENWTIFARRWGYDPAYPVNGYDARPAIRRGIQRDRDFVPLPIVEPPKPVGIPAAPTRAESCAVAFLAIVDDEAAWTRIGPAVSNFVRSLDAGDRAILAIAATGELDADTIGNRVVRAATRAKRDPDKVADVVISDVTDIDAWLADIAAENIMSLARDERLDAYPLAQDRSPSGFLRAVRGSAVR